MQKIGQRIAYIFQAAGIAFGFALVRLLPVDWASALGGHIARTFGPLAFRIVVSTQSCEPAMRPAHEASL